MAGWFIPALKAVLPHVGTIISAAKPVFTRKPADAGSGEPGVLQRQVAELQTAVLQNASNIQQLATDLQTTLAALEQAAVTAQANLKRAQLLAASALGLSAVALALAAFLLLTR
jgi:hypothetical protein